MFENIRHGAVTDIGLVRFNNEDSFVAVDRSDNRHAVDKYGMLFIVADGIGGHAAGEIASKIACAAVVAAYYSEDADFEGGGNGNSLIGKLEKSIWSAHDKIVDVAAQRREWRGMGTTLTALALIKDKALIAHVGDSRIYRCRQESCERLTTDHTKMQEMIEVGQIGQEDRYSRNFDYYGSIITQALGGYDDLDTVFIRVDDLLPGDIFLLSTDGLHDRVTDFEIQEILRKNSLPQAACDELVQAAMRKGGHDNITVIVIRT